MPLDAKVVEESDIDEIEKVLGAELATAHPRLLTQIKGSCVDELKYSVMARKQNDIVGCAVFEKLPRDTEHFEINIGRINTDDSDEHSYMILSSNGDVRIRLDNDGGESGVFRIRDSGSSDVCTVNESGDLTISGHLTKNTGSFRIDHPLDPKNKYLYHSLVESPDMKNIYDGVVELDENGEAWIEFPDWFEALNRDFRYQITPIGAPGPNLYVADEVSDNRFKIAGGDPGMKVSWQVTCIRHDPYANAHPISVEKDKPPEERGYYSHPELYGQPAQIVD